MSSMKKSQHYAINLHAKQGLTIALSRNIQNYSNIS